MKGFNRNNVKLSYIGDPEFYINERKRTVTCNLKARLIGPQELLDGWLGGDIGFPTKNIKSSATAHCHKDDKFEVERGKRIALSKAENDLYSQASLNISEFCEKLDFLRDACNEFFHKSVRCQAHNIDYIDSLSMPAHPRYNNDTLPPKRGVEVTHIKV